MSKGAWAVGRGKEEGTPPATHCLVSLRSALLRGCTCGKWRSEVGDMEGGGCTHLSWHWRAGFHPPASGEPMQPCPPASELPRRFLAERQRCARMTRTKMSVSRTRGAHSAVRIHGRLRASAGRPNMGSGRISLPALGPEHRPIWLRSHWGGESPQGLVSARPRPTFGLQWQLRLRSRAGPKLQAALGYWDLGA